MTEGPADRSALLGRPAAKSVTVPPRLHVLSTLGSDKLQIKCKYSFTTVKSRDITTPQDSQQHALPKPALNPPPDSATTPRKARHSLPLASPLGLLHDPPHERPRLARELPPRPLEVIHYHLRQREQALVLVRDGQQAARRLGAEPREVGRPDLARGAGGRGGRAARCEGRKGWSANTTGRLR